MTDQHASIRQHRCMRCNQVFTCTHGPNCSAQFDVLPTVVFFDDSGKVATRPHCPEKPDWGWIRDYGDRMRAQGHIEATKVFAQSKMLITGTETDAPIRDRAVAAIDAASSELWQTYGPSERIGPIYDGLQAARDTVAEFASRVASLEQQVAAAEARASQREDLIRRQAEKIAELVTAEARASQLQQERDDAWLSQTMSGEGRCERGHHRRFVYELAVAGRHGCVACEKEAAEARASQAERDALHQFPCGHFGWCIRRGDGSLNPPPEGEQCVPCRLLAEAREKLEAAEARADLLQRERVSASVSEIREGEDNTGELDSVDLYVAGRGISLLVNVTAQTREVTYSLGVNGVHQQAATILGPLHATPHGGTDREVMQQIVQILGPVTCHCAGCMLEIQKVKELLRTRGIEWTDLPQTKKEKTDEQ